MKEKLTLQDHGDFVWGYGQTFFIETEKGNFVWSDPDYDGDNTIIHFPGTYNDWLKKSEITYAIDKGHHSILDYCGPDVKII